MDIKDILNSAAKDGLILDIVYHGGSHPGSKREISPIRIKGDKVFAMDMPTGKVKCYLLNRIEIVSEDYQAPKYSPDAPIKSFSGFCEEYKDELKRLGWHVESGKSSLCVHSFFKNGKIRKTPVAGIFESLYREDQVYDIDTDNFVSRRVKSKRPYYVFGPGLDKARSFKDIKKPSRCSLNWQEGMLQKRRGNNGELL